MSALTYVMDRGGYSVYTPPVGRNSSVPHHLAFVQTPHPHGIDRNYCDVASYAVTPHMPSVRVFIPQVTEFCEWLATVASWQPPF